LLLICASCAPGSRPAAGAIEIAFAAGSSADQPIVRVTGLSGGELRALRDARFAEADWQALLTTTVTDNPAAPVSGRFVVADAALEFHPRFRFDPGRSYSVRFDPARLPTPRTGPPLEVRLRTEAQPAAASSTTVVAIYPSASVWPENMLRFYVHFSAPMSRGAGTKFVHLLDEAGREVPDAILAAYSDLWNPDATRLTVFLDPGRVKRGVGPNVRMGRAIVSGHRYAISVDAAWKDANERPLAGPFKREFTAGSANYAALSTGDWKIAAPAAGTRGDLVLTFPAPLDRALLERAIGVRRPSGQAMAGAITVDREETGWRFTPQTAWEAGAYVLDVLTLLEDPVGNRIGRAFEVLPSEGVQPKADRESVEVKFQVAGKR
jgi:hypothetical protein